MKSWHKVAWFMVVLCLSSGFVLAQDNTCSATVQQAISTVQDDCAATGRNQACYGNVLLEATPRDTATNFTFDDRGDIINVVDLERLRVSAFDPASNTWGIALMQVQANLPDTLPGQNVTFLLFGDVEIQNAVPASEPLTTIAITSSGNINVRSGPSTNYRVAGSLANGTATSANGRNQDSSWLRILLPDSDVLGWVFADLVTPDGDVSTLSVVDAAATDMPLTPMQAFRFSAGLGNPNCTDAPQDGILIQTPQGVGKIALRVNDVAVQLGSTAYLQAQPGANMTVSLLDGEGQVTANGASVSVPAGAQVDVPVDANLNASGEPSDPRPYDADLMQPLPVQALPQSITIAPPATDEQLQATNQQPGGFGGGVPGFDFPDMAGMDMAAMCPIVRQALAEAGMTAEQYLSQMQQVIDMMPAAQSGGLIRFGELIKACQ